MGWLRLSVPAATSIIHETKSSDASVEHIEHIDLKLPNEDLVRIDVDLRRQYPVQPTILPDEALPFISGDVVRASKHDPSTVWVVIDDIVYDCTDYVQEHPGGSTVIESFSGEDCSWQFWRFHNQKIMRGQGRALRVGRTKGVVNRYKERSRFVGLQRHGMDDDW